MHQPTKININHSRMNSIWIDEDQEAEKIYTFQTHRFSESDDEDEALGVALLNSDQPVLGSKRNISLPPLLSFSSTDDSLSFDSSDNSLFDSPIKKSPAKRFISLFNIKQPVVAPKKMHITTPFGFQHISHGSFKPTSPDETGLTSNTKYNGQSTPTTPTPSYPLNCAFRTESIPDTSYNSDHTSIQSRSRSITPIQLNSSKKCVRYKSCKRQKPLQMPISARNVPNLNEASNTRPVILPPARNPTRLLKSKLKENTNSYEDISPDFLKEYDFPSLLENYTEADNLDDDPFYLTPKTPK
ncbi:Gic2p NDAI_0C04260 [Naumovozyma dairenensis CBS 421]|uniref:CRIB domain-containing protein n=1 Tax=Naumovozyma dairenensis (strain ATCC 10597 / BCRC 20456 / CBS 421 / NBRC 0211 / NRRL Y-12639) TaxID=1071378 RepID=G0W8H5_NAUDC|nr:hypothetical protein NDAI_0C04260 [Naumovozyma dairenensis CBS 421]CCD24086.1 hypothetical protein NDAI_0C04260 [Naumovozyma dairenensis CBS 421]